MSGDDLFAAEESIIAAAEQLLADDGFGATGEREHFQQLLKSYQKLFRTARRLMRLGDHNERQLNDYSRVAQPEFLFHSTRTSRVSGVVGRGGGRAVFGGLRIFRQTPALPDLLVQSWIDSLR
jgi:hypothetical protein